jgi:hypothetical protein
MTGIIESSGAILRNLHPRTESAHYTTLHEKRYIENIGTYGNRAIMPSRIEMLKKYLETMDVRTNWNGINKDEIERFVKEQIKNELNK